MGPPAGRRPAGMPMLDSSRLESGRNPTRKPDFRPETPLHNIKNDFPEFPHPPLSKKRYNAEPNGVGGKNLKTRRFGG